MMSHLLKRTKKSCIKIFRKISSSKQLFAKKTDENDDTTNNNNNNNNSSKNNNNNSNNNNSNKANNAIHNTIHSDHMMKIETSPMPKEKVNHSFRKSTESLPSTPTTYHKHESENEMNMEMEVSPRAVTKPIMTFELDDGSPSNTILHRLTARLFLTADGYDFHRLQHLRSDTGSEVVQFDVHDTTDFIEDDNIVFEKVKYKDDIRYFRHTPSNSSLDNYRLNSVATTPDYEYTPEFDLQSENWHFDNEGNQRVSHHHHFTNFGFHAPKESFLPTISMSLGSKLNGNRQNVIISQERDNNNKLMPVVKWDINGNSLDDDDDEILPHEYLEDFDKRLSKRLAAVQHLQTVEDDDDESNASSLRSSSTTLETWVDEDLIVENTPIMENFELTLQDNRCLIKA